MARLYLSPPHLSGQELDLVREALESNWITTLGPQVAAFERELADAVNVPHALAVSSGTAALHLALAVLGIGPGDDVACSDLTFAATANAIVYTGARPFFVDCDDSWTIDPDLLDRAVVDRRAAGATVRALVAVDLYGQCCDYKALADVCARHDILLVQDAAESLGSTYLGEPAGRPGVRGAFSFNGNKIITTSGGGMLVSDDESLVEHARKLATQARDPGPYYQHSELGFNYRMSNVLAAIGRAQLRALPERVAARQAINALYRQLLEDLPGLSFLERNARGEPNDWLTCVMIDPRAFGADRETVRLALEAHDIEARPVWKPMHLQPYYADHVCFGGDVGATLFRDGLCLPSGSALTSEDQERVARIIRATQAVA